MTGSTAAVSHPRSANPPAANAPPMPRIGGLSVALIRLGSVSKNSAAVSTYEGTICQRYPSTIRCTSVRTTITAGKNLNQRSDGRKGRYRVSKALRFKITINNSNGRIGILSKKLVFRQTGSQPIIDAEKVEGLGKSSKR